VTWIWPLTAEPLLPDAPGRFGVQRKHDYHTGIDLYCEPSTEVVAVEDGVVVSIEPFTGPEAGSAWWHETMAVLVEGQSGVVVYGEIDPSVSLDEKIIAGKPIGSVLPVLKTFKGRPMVMLHLELMTHGTKRTLWWKLDQPRPSELRSPEPLLPPAPVFVLANYDQKSFRPK
jgi:murein DD-endopeptidase MepM/ murein hydrolase activator NlpD